MTVTFQQVIDMLFIVNNNSSLQNCTNTDDDTQKLLILLGSNHLQYQVILSWNFMGYCVATIERPKFINFCPLCHFSFYALEFRALLNLAI